MDIHCYKFIPVPVSAVTFHRLCLKTTNRSRSRPDSADYTLNHSSMRWKVVVSSFVLGALFPFIHHEHGTASADRKPGESLAPEFKKVSIGVKVRKRVTQGWIYRMNLKCKCVQHFLAIFSSWANEFFWILNPTSVECTITQCWMRAGFQTDERKCSWNFPREWLIIVHVSLIIIVKI